MILSEIGDLRLFVLTHNSSNNGRRSPFTNIYGSPLLCYCKQNPCVSLAAERSRQNVRIDRHTHRDADIHSLMCSIVKNFQNYIGKLKNERYA